ncbi:MAG: 30S ribosomal protein S5, partial [Lachnospiraceae bacterium]|nr:30S ribosomal protein S5 [Lachnospiraceae bacterium]
GSHNKQNVVLAAIEGLAELKRPEEVARKRGKAVADVLA